MGQKKEQIYDKVRQYQYRSGVLKMLKSLQRNQGSVQTEQGQSGIASRAAMFTQPVAPLNLQAPKAPLTQTTVKRSLPTPPVKSTQSVGAASTASQAPQFFPPAVELPQPPEGGDINVQVRHWARISGSKYNPQQIALALENAKKLIDTGLVDFTSIGSNGNTIVHCAALTNNIDLVDYVFKHPNYKIDVNALNVQSNTDALSKAIASKHFELAIKLISIYKADVHNSVRVNRDNEATGKKEKDNTVDILRKTFIQCLGNKPSEFSEVQRKLLDQLIVLLVEKKLTFFRTRKELLSPVFELENYTIPLSADDEEKMQRSSLNEKQYSKLLQLDKLKEYYPETFRLFWKELERAINVDPKANELWTIWHHRITLKPNYISNSLEN